MASGGPVSQKDTLARRGRCSAGGIHNPTGFFQSGRMMLSLEPIQGSHHYYVNIASPTLVYHLKKCSEQNSPVFLVLATVRPRLFHDTPTLRLTFPPRLSRSIGKFSATALSKLPRTHTKLLDFSSPTEDRRAYVNWML